MKSSGGMVMTEWKALANAIVHGGFDPNLMGIKLVCEQCKNPHVWLRYHVDVDSRNSEFERFSVYLMECPNCGHTELNVIGTYNMDDVSWALSGVVDSIQKYFTALREMQTYA